MNIYEIEYNDEYLDSDEWRKDKKAIPYYVIANNFNSAVSKLNSIDLKKFTIKSIKLFKQDTLVVT